MLRLNDLSEFQVGLDYTHSKTLQQKQKQNKDQKANSKVHPVSQLSEHSPNINFIIALGLVLETEASVSHATVVGIAPTTALYTYPPTPTSLSKRVLLCSSGWSPQTSGLKWPCFSFPSAPAPGTSYHSFCSIFISVLRLPTIYENLLSNVFDLSLRCHFLWLHWFVSQLSL